MPQIPFAFEFECERLNDLCVAKLPFGNHTFFIENGNLAGHFKVINIYIIECEWPNSNLNDLCIDRIAIQPFTLKCK